MSSKEIQCSYCGAPLEVMEGQTVIKCEFCDTVNSLDTAKEAVLRRYMLSIHFEKTQAREALVGDLSKIPGCPPDLSTNLTFVEAELKYLPFYLINVRGETYFAGMGRTATYSNWFKSGYRNIFFSLKPETDRFQDMKQYVVYAGPQVQKEIMDYTIATRGRVFFDKANATKFNATIIEPEMNEENARETGKSLLKNYHDNIVHEEVQEIEELQQQQEIDEISLIYAPIWFVKFKIAGLKQYEAMIDASTGRTIYTETPRRMRHYFIIGLLAMKFLIISGIGYLLFYLFELNAVAVFLGIMGAFLALQGLIEGWPRKFKEQIS